MMGDYENIDDLAEYADLLLIHHMIEGEWDEVARLATMLDEQDAGGIHPSEIQTFDCNLTEQDHA